jgi:hypothetical protein
MKLPKMHLYQKLLLPQQKLPLKYRQRPQHQTTLRYLKIEINCNGHQKALKTMPRLQS